MKVILLAAMSVDGFIGQDKEHSSFEWTSLEDKQFYVSKIKEIKTVVMGSTSFKTFTKYPKGLRFIIYTSKPDEFVNPKPHVIAAEGTTEDPKMLIERLEREGVQEVAIAGGASIYAQFMNAGVVNTLFLTVEPIIFGEGVKLFNTKMEKHLKLVNIHDISEQTKVMEYLVL